MTIVIGMLEGFVYLYKKLCKVSSCIVELHSCNVHA